MNSPIIDLAVVLIFTYLLLSIISSTLYEVFLTIGRARSKMLKHALNNLFFDDEWRNNTSKLLLDSPTVKALKKSDKSFPAYVPASSFTNAIIGIIRNQSTAPLTIESIRQKLNDETSLIKGDARVALLNILDSTENDYNKFITGLENFYDDYMDRVSGWFKLKYQWVMVIISAIVTLTLNADSIAIAKRLWSNPSELVSTANLVSTQVEDFSLSEDNQFIVHKINGQTVSIPLVYHIDTTAISADSALILLGEQKRTIQLLVESLNNSSILMGWQSKKEIVDTFQWKPNLAIKIAGWLITTLAIFIGAPTWFDIIIKLVNLRGTGKKPAPSSHT